MRRTICGVDHWKAAQFIREIVIDVAVMSFIGAHDKDHIAQGRLVRQAPIFLGDGRRGHIGRTALIDLGQIIRNS
jgi:hypothetical protein